MGSLSGGRKLTAAIREMAGNVGCGFWVNWVYQGKNILFVMQDQSFDTVGFSLSISSGGVLCVTSCGCGTPNVCVALILVRINEATP